jgi:hypothetical protein
MIINKRKIGVQSGFFVGKEIEHTKFYGMDTIFFSKLTAANDYFRIISRCVPYSHMFFGVCNSDFLDMVVPADSQFDLLVAYATSLIQFGKKVTFELTPSQALDSRVTALRSSPNFCAMICVEVPLVGLGNFAIKAVPTHVFEDRPNEHYVATIDSIDLLREKHLTSWDEYAADIDGDDIVQCSK